MKSEEEMDTVPPSPDPILPYVERIEHKIDLLSEAVQALANEVSRLNAKDRKRDEQVEYMEQRIRHFTPASGLAAVGRNGNGDGSDV